MYGPFIDEHWSKIVPPAWSPHHPSTPSPYPRSNLARLHKERPKGLAGHPVAQDREDEQGLTGLDRFATTFTPQWLKELQPPFQTYRLPPLSPFPLESYAANVYTPISMRRPELGICPSIIAIPPHHLSPPLHQSSRPLDSVLAGSDSKYYAVHFSTLLSLHLFAQTIEANGAKVYSAPVSLQSMAEHTFRLHIPGVREDVPALGLGDRLHLRGLYPLLKAPSQVAVEAEVVGLVKAQGFVYVRSPALAALDVSLPKSPQGSEYQIEFSISGAPVLAMQDAVRLMSIALESSLCARNWLFPDMPATQGDITIDWIDKDLNSIQKAAVTAIATTQSPVPHLIIGPPGTGKTKTLTEVVLQILNHRSEAAILVTAPSNSAADTLARRLSKTLKPAEMFRLNAPHRTFAEVPGDLLPYCASADGSFDLPPFKQLMRYRVVVCSLIDSAILRTARATNADIMQAQNIFQQSFFPANPIEAKLHWTHLVIDEAAQASEPEALIPLSVVLPNDSSVTPVVVLCGDPHQLGPIIASAAARSGELDVSLLERLSQRPAYQSGGITHLVQNYRSIAPILMVPSSMFYNDTLVPAATDVNLVKWTKLPNPDIPILFSGCETPENCVDEGASWFNTGEISATVELVQSLLAEIPDLLQNQIAVMTPWREQVWRMRRSLRRTGLSEVDVGNIETYQGREFRVTIISCVRSQKRFLPEDKRTNMGIYNERRRFNVAITRAKELLVIVGNANLLKGDPYWNGLLQIARRNSLYRGPDVKLEMTGAYISKIESKLRQAGSARGAEDDDGLFLAGELARATLMDE